MHVGTAAYVTVLLQVRAHNRGLISAYLLMHMLAYVATDL